MKGLMMVCVVAAILFILMILVPATMFSTRHTEKPHSNEGGPDHCDHEEDGSAKRAVKVKLSRVETVRLAGSKLPDCSHACGPCTPCLLVTVRFACASPAEAETCPVAYKCMCNHKSFPVP